MLISTCQNIANKIFRKTAFFSPNLALVLYNQEDLRLEERSTPTPGPNEVVVTIKAVALDHNDLELFNKCDENNNNKGYIPGREACGVVKEIGKEVTDLKVGDRVTLLYFDELSKDEDGSLYRYKLIDADCCYKIPNEISFRDGALLIPLAVAIYAFKRMGMTADTNLLIWGADTVGLATLLLAKLIGVEQIAVADFDKSRLEMAKKLGADGDFEITSSVEEKETIEQIKNNFFRELRVIESSILNEVDLYELYRFNRECFETAIDFISLGKINVSSLVSETFSFEESPKAIKTLEKARAGKVMIFC